MGNDRVDAVTGAFGFTGRYVAYELLGRGRQVRALVRDPGPETVLAGAVVTCPLDFDDPGGLVESLQGVDTLYNTYWVRFDRGGASHVGAVVDTEVLLGAAKRAGVRRVVHVSASGADRHSPLSYHRGKGWVEEAVRDSGLSHAIVRPTLLFGEGDVLVNNIAWFLRRLPVFLVPGDGRYRVRPVYVGDLARLMVDLGSVDGNLEVRVVGPETFTFSGLVEKVGESVGSRARVLSCPPALVLGAAWLMGKALRDVVLTREEALGLMDGLLWTEGAPAGRTRFSEWLEGNGSRLGLEYANELRLHYWGTLPH